MANTYEGSCHCGALGFMYTSALEPSRWPIRICQCEGVFGLVTHSVRLGVRGRADRPPPTEVDSGTVQASSRVGYLRIFIAAFHGVKTMIFGYGDDFLYQALGRNRSRSGSTVQLI